MLYLTCTIVSCVDLAHYGVNGAKDWVFVDCGTINLNFVVSFFFVFVFLFIFFFWGGGGGRGGGRLKGPHGKDRILVYGMYVPHKLHHIFRI